MTLKNNRAPFLFYDTLSFVHHFNAIGKFKLKFKSGKAQLGSRSTIFLAMWPRNFYGWPWKTIGHLLYATSSFVHYFVPIGEFNLELQSGNAQFGSNSTIFRAMWPCNLTNDLEKTIGHFFYATSSCVSFRSHWWIQTGDTVRKRPIWVKFDDFRAVWP